jgi:predicted dehydrogenase
VYTGPAHPYGESLWPIPALGIGYTETKIIEMYEFIKAVSEGRQVEPNFEDGYNIELLGEAAFKSASSGLWEKVGAP